jgi:hypothetical protein
MVVCTSIIRIACDPRFYLVILILFVSRCISSSDFVPALRKKFYRELLPGSLLDMC